MLPYGVSRLFKENFKLYTSFDCYSELGIVEVSVTCGSLYGGIVTVQRAIIGSILTFAVVMSLRSTAAFADSTAITPTAITDDATSAVTTDQTVNYTVTVAGNASSIGAYTTRLDLINSADPGYVWYVWLAPSSSSTLTGTFVVDPSLPNGQYTVQDMVVNGLTIDAANPAVKSASSFDVANSPALTMTSASLSGSMVSANQPLTVHLAFSGDTSKMTNVVAFMQGPDGQVVSVPLSYVTATGDFEGTITYSDLGQTGQWQYRGWSYDLTNGQPGVQDDTVYASFNVTDAPLADQLPEVPVAGILPIAIGLATLGFHALHRRIRKSQ